MRVRESIQLQSMIEGLVNGFVHCMFLSEADRLLSASPAVFVASPAQETENNVLPALNVSVFES